MSQFIEGEYKVRIDGTSTGRGPVIYVPNYWNDGKDDWEFCEFESTEVRDSRARKPKSKWKPTPEHNELMATAILFAAAPKLLESLIDCLSLVRLKYGNLDPDANAIQQQAEQAIELATNTSAPIEKLVAGQPEREE